MTTIRLLSAACQEGDTGTPFSLRALFREVWNEFGSDNPGVLVTEIARRIPVQHQADALEEALVTYVRLFSATKKRADKRTPIRERLERRTKHVGDCFIWTGKIHENGYGAITITDGGSRKILPVHRVSYETFVGPIPPGYEIDHQCHSRDPDACPQPCIHVLCWNPEHLRAVTRAENLKRRRTRPAKTHCRYGHEFTPENTYRPPGNPQVRICLTCRRRRGREKYHLDKAAQAA